MCIYVFMVSMFVRLCVCVYSHVGMFAHVWMHWRMYLCVYLCISHCISVYIRVYLCICVHMCVFNQCIHTICIVILSSDIVWKKKRRKKRMVPSLPHVPGRATHPSMHLSFHLYTYIYIYTPINIYKPLSTYLCNYASLCDCIFVCFYVVYLRAHARMYRGRCNKCRNTLKVA